MMPAYDFPTLFYCCSSFICIDLLLQVLTLFLEENVDIKPKLYEKYFLRMFIFIICFIYSIYFILYEGESFTWFHYLLFPLPSFVIYAYLKKKKGYTDADINNCQRDAESIGALWAHQAFVAYYKTVLQSIEDRMTLFEKENDSKFLIKKLIIVVPFSCNVENILTYRDPDIKEIGVLETIEYDQGGNVNRKLKNPVYGIDKTVCIAAEYPSTLNTLWKIKDDIDKEKLKYHRDCFIKTLKFLVKDSPCIVAQYDDTDNSQEPLRRFLLNLLTKREYTILPLE